MRRMTYFVMALALVLGFTQCKKEQPLEPPGEQVRITLNVKNASNNGAKVDVTGPDVNFTAGDQIHVVSDGKHVGTLVAAGSVGNVTFSGSITGAVTEQPLYFYFLGNKDGDDIVWTVDKSSNKVGCTVNISDQTSELPSELPVISFAPSDQIYYGEGTYSATLQNKCSLIKFNVTTHSTSAICITGMNNQVTVNFANRTENDGFSYGKADANGVIMMKGVASYDSYGVATWAIVLQQDQLTAGDEGSAYTGTYVGVRPEVPAITMDQYLDEYRHMTVDTPQP